MIRRLSSIALTLGAFALTTRSAMAQQTQPNDRLRSAPMTPQPQVQVQAQPVYTSAPAYSAEGVDRPGGIIGGVLGFGAHAGSGFGLGVEGGYTLPMQLGPGHLYIGGVFDYFFGSDNVSAYLFEVQVGYDLGVIHAAPVLIRPYAGLGYENFSIATPAGVNCTVDGVNVCASAGGGSAVISFGAMGAYFFTPHFYAGADLRLDVATAAYGYVVFNFFATGGYKF